jgi:predicted phosphodiesterase
MDRLTESATKEFISWIETTSPEHTFEDLGVFACHGSPNNPLEGYLYPDTDIKRPDAYPWNICMTGHTHYPMLRWEGGKIFFNPGSAGQPRHGGPPSYAVLFLPEVEIRFREFRYNKNDLIRQIEQSADPHPYLIEVLNR